MVFVKLSIVKGRKYKSLVKGYRDSNGKVRHKVIKYLGKVRDIGVLRGSIIKKVFDKFGYCCGICYSQENLIIDHIIPLSKGGTNNISNLQVLCLKCNQKKGDLILDTPNVKYADSSENSICENKLFSQIDSAEDST